MTKLHSKEYRNSTKEILNRFFPNDITDIIKSYNNENLEKKRFNLSIKISNFLKNRIPPCDYIHPLIYIDIDSSYVKRTIQLNKMYTGLHTYI